MREKGRKKAASHNLFFDPNQQRLMHTCVLWTLVGHCVCVHMCVSLMLCTQLCKLAGKCAELTETQ